MVANARIEMCAFTPSADFTVLHPRNECSCRLGDDSRFIQISAPVQPGRSGGPLIDASGHVVGLVTGKLKR